MHSKSPSVMTFYLCMSRDFGKNMPKRLAGYYLLNSYSVSIYTYGRLCRQKGQLHDRQVQSLAAPQEFSAYGVHDRDHFIERDKLCDACKSHLSSDQGDGNTGSIAVLAGIFYQSANRVTYESEAYS